MDRTFVILKPDAVQRRLLGKTIGRFEDKGIQIVALKMLRIPEAKCRELYGIHKGKDFYEPLVRYMSSGPVVVAVLQGKNVIEIARRLMGATFGSKAEPGTIRGDFGMSNRFNLIHGSDSRESFEREMPLFFSKDETVDCPPADLTWVYDLSGPEPV
ncbi:MAG: nucleoside-diphosphate kinase [Planctomycetes bacterium]|nr:nucleoside-diphosphate kinase [Planctomycetota bacterium]